MAVVARINGNTGKVEGWDAEKKGWLGAFTSYFANQEGVMKSFSIWNDWTRVISGQDQIGRANLFAMSEGFKAAGAACSISKAIVGWLKAAGDVSQGRIATAKGLGNASNAVSETSEFFICVKEMGGLALSNGVIAILKVSKGGFKLLADFFNLYEVRVLVPAKITKNVEKLSDGMLGEVKKENKYATARVIAGITLHAYLFIGVVGLAPLMPLAITGLASAYITALTANHFAKEFLEDKRAEWNADKWNAQGKFAPSAR